MRRSVVMEQFGLLVNQASRDLSRSIDFAPDDMVYDTSAQIYVGSSKFETSVIKPNVFRRHMRVIPREEQCFKCFLLFRELEIHASHACEVRQEEDRDWNTEVTLEVGLHPGLSEIPTKASPLGYGMHGGMMRFVVQQALLCCGLRRLGLDIYPSARSWRNQKIALLNAASLSPTATAANTHMAMVG